jgi:hypothetical protein
MRTMLIHDWEEVKRKIMGHIEGCVTHVLLSTSQPYGGEEGDKIVGEHTAGSSVVLTLGRVCCGSCVLYLCSDIILHLDF